MIRPPDPLVTLPLLACGPYRSHEAIRGLLHLAYRDCETVLDLTWGSGAFWSPPLPDGLTLHANAWPRNERLPNGTYSVDYTDKAAWDALPRHDLVVYDPPHVADAGEDGLYKARYGTATGTLGLVWNIQAGMRAAATLATVGVLVKVADSAHNGLYMGLSDHVKIVAGEYGLAPYCVLYAYRNGYVRDPKHRMQRVPRNNVAIYIAFRYDARHRDWDGEYTRQQKGDTQRTPRRATLAVAATAEG